MDIMIGIPARYGSTRFPGKPLAMIGEKTMIAHVVDRANEAAEALNALPDVHCSVFVTTDDDRIITHVRDTLNVDVVKTPDTCPTGSDRVLAALRQMDDWPDFLINLQGDAPFTSAHILSAIMHAFIEDPTLNVVTPVHQLGWEQLDDLRAHKVKAPFSGTTAVMDESGKALWFSKSILPAIRAEQALRVSQELSPVYQHIGVYGYRPDILEKFCELPQSPYEMLEGLEQLRFLENGIDVQTVRVEVDQNGVQTGIDTPEDLERAVRSL